LVVEPDIVYRSSNLFEQGRKRGKRHLLSLPNLFILEERGKGGEGGHSQIANLLISPCISLGMKGKGGMSTCRLDRRAEVQRGRKKKRGVGLGRANIDQPQKEKEGREE